MQNSIKLFSSILFIFAVFALQISAQTPAKSTVSIPVPTLVQIVRAEDELRFDKVLETLLSDKNAEIRKRAALAAGRIGNESAIPFLINLLEKDESDEVRVMSVFALGEIESVKGADAIIKVLADTKADGKLRARTIEAAGKIAAAISASDKAKAENLGEAILDALDFEDRRRSAPNTDAILFGLTAVLRVRPTDGDFVAAKFLTYSDVRIRQNATNTLARLRAKNANDQMKVMLLTDDDAVVRANSARILGIAEDKTALDLLITAATEDDDQRVRVAAIRALVNLKDKKAVEPLFASAEKLFENYKKAKVKVGNPSEKNELLEIVTTLGRLLANSDDERAIKFLKEFREADNFSSSETEIAFARISPNLYVKEFEKPPSRKSSWQAGSSRIQGLAELSNLPDEKIYIRQKAAVIVNSLVLFQPSNDSDISLILPDILRALAVFKKDITIPPLPPPASKLTSEDYLSSILKGFVKFREKSLPNEESFFGFNNNSGYFDPNVRATAAELLSELPSSKENIEALKTAFVESLKNDKDSNDATLAILSALVKLDKAQSFESLRLALNAPDFLVRRHAADLIKKNDLTKDFANIEKFVGTVKPSNAKNASKLGVLLNTNADYVRAVSRKNGSVKAILTTEKGAFTIDLMPEDAPLNVDNFIKLAKSGYFNGIAFHRVVPNFVAQGGDPRGDGNGGPGYQIRCEINMLEYERGAVGMALSGKDTGGSQWFATHSSQPHLDGGYTVFGKVNESEMKIVDLIARGDKILSVKILENLPQRSQRTQSKKK